MRVKCLLAFILIILCIMASSGCLGFEEKTEENIKSNVSEKENPSANSEKFPDYEKYPSSEDPVFEEVKFDKNSLRFSEILIDFDVVTTDPNAFQKAAADGTLKLYLRGQVFEIEFDEVETSIPKTIMENESGLYTIEGAPISSYKGKVADIEDSRVLITIAENVVIGSIEIGYTTGYYIEQTNQTLNGKVVHVIYSSEDYRPVEYTEYNDL